MQSRAVRALLHIIYVSNLSAVLDRRVLADLVFYNSSCKCPGSFCSQQVHGLLTVLI